MILNVGVVVGCLCVYKEMDYSAYRVLSNPSLFSIHLLKQYALVYPAIGCASFILATLGLNLVEQLYQAAKRQSCSWADLHQFPDRREKTPMAMILSIAGLHLITCGIVSKVCSPGTFASTVLNCSMIGSLALFCMAPCAVCGAQCLLGF